MTPKFDMTTREGQIKALMFIGYCKEKAVEAVDAGRFDDELQYAYRAIVTDPVGVGEEEDRQNYPYTGTVEKPAF